MKSSGNIKIGAVIKGYFWFLLAVGILLVAGAVCIFIFPDKARIIAIGLLGFFIIAAVIFIILNSKKFSANLLSFARDYETMESRVIEKFPIPYAITDKTGKIIVYNRRFGKIFGLLGEQTGINDIFDGVRLSELVFKDGEANVSVKNNNRNWRLSFHKISLDGQFAGNQVAALRRKDSFVLAVYLHDETEIVKLMQSINDERPVICSVTIDDYEDLFERVDDIRKSMVLAQIDKEIADYFTGIGGLVRKTDQDNYFAIFQYHCLATLRSNKFDILDRIKAIYNERDIPVTISIGIGVGDRYEESQRYAKEALELALGRGGDQVAVKEGDRLYFYGGKTKSTEKNTRVKARYRALSLKDKLMSKSRVVIMGHKIGDMDCFGSAVGIYKIAMALGKEVYIILNELNNTVHPILDDFLDSNEYGDRAFLSAEEAVKYVNEDTALVITDVNRPDIFECPELIHKTNTVLMIDHHLQSGDRIDNVVYSYVEPTASSASEMVADILRYIPDVHISKLDAEALYAGILIDTDYFTKNTGVKTFEAAAYLRKNGVDIGRVNGLFSDTLDDFRIKADIISNAEIFEDKFAIAICPSEECDNPTIVAAQVANKLLSLSGVEASFVLAYYREKIYISARSVNKVNVQLIMERMGGGGHMNVAGAQLERNTISEAEKKLKLTIKKMLEEGILE